MLTFGGKVFPTAMAVWHHWHPMNVIFFFFFACLAMRDVLKTWVALARRRIIGSTLSPSGCLVARRTGGGNNIQYVLQMHPSMQVWIQLVGLSAFNQNQYYNGNVLSHEQGHPQQLAKNLSTAVIAVSWDIWLPRNRKSFHNFTLAVSTIKDNCKQTLKV